MPSLSDQQHADNLGLPQTAVVVDSLQLKDPPREAGDNNGSSNNNNQRTMTDQVSSSGSSSKLFFCFIGIFVCYFYYGILQEKITKTKYGDGAETEKFTYTIALVFVQCCINAAFAKTALTVSPPGPDTTTQKLYLAMTVSYLGAMLCSFGSLQFVSYPMQVLGKSVKPIPVMILGVIFAHKRYPLQKYVFVLMIVLGVGMFMYKDKKGQALDSDHTYGWGEFLLCMSLLLDGATGATQDRMRAEHQTKTHHIMYNVNWWSILILGTGLLLTGEGLQFIGFAQRFPYVLFNMGTFGIASALGQHFIFMTVSNFGPLTCSIFTTTRKFFTILGSVLIFGHTMVGRQWLGTLCVFIGLGLDSMYGKERKTIKPSKPNNSH